MCYAFKIEHLSSISLNYRFFFKYCINSVKSRYIVIFGKQFCLWIALQTVFLITKMCMFILQYRFYISIIIISKIKTTCYIQSLIYTKLFRYNTPLNPENIPQTLLINNRNAPYPCRHQTFACDMPDSWASARQYRSDWIDPLNLAYSAHSLDQLNCNTLHVASSMPFLQERRNRIRY